MIICRSALIPSRLPCPKKFLVTRLQYDNKMSKKRLVVILDNKLKYDKHVENIYQKASSKLNALASLTNYMELPKRRILINTFFKAQFNYCSVVWMLHTCFLKLKINCLHERCLKIIYNNKRSNFEELLVKDNSNSIQRNNIYTLAIEMPKVADGMSPEILNNISKLRDNTYHLRHTSQFLADPIHSVFNGSESALYLGPKTCEQIPSEIKYINCIDDFKKEIRKVKTCELSLQNL